MPWPRRFHKLEGAPITRKGPSMNHPRPARWESSLSAEVYTRTEVVTASAENLSTGGVCLQVDASLCEDELVGISMFPVCDGIEDPDAKPLNLPAVVVWCDDGSGPNARAGMRFVTESVPGGRPARRNRGS